jgi:hypothetical protein
MHLGAHRHHDDDDAIAKRGLPAHGCTQAMFDRVLSEAAPKTVTCAATALNQCLSQVQDPKTSLTRRRSGCHESSTRAIVATLYPLGTYRCWQ